MLILVGACLFVKNMSLYTLIVLMGINYNFYKFYHHLPVISPILFAVNVYDIYTTVIACRLFAANPHGVFHLEMVNCEKMYRVKYWKRELYLSDI